MPLLDPFHKPLHPYIQWQSLHTGWMTYLTADINRELPRTFFATPSRHLGIEIDIAALERLGEPAEDGTPGWRPTWQPPPASTTLPFTPAVDEVEVLIHGETYDGLRLVGAVELVSPANKDRAETREAFVSKCHDYLQRGVGVLIVDVVTERHANLHDELVARLGQPAARIGGHLYAISYRPTGRNGVGELAVWTEALAVGRPLPTMPFWLYGGVCVPTRLEETYDQTCRELRVYDVLRWVTPQPQGAA